MSDFKGKRPKLTSEGGFVFSRKNFVEGKVKTFWGPDQPPNAGAHTGAPDGYVFGDKGQNTVSPVVKAYQPPDDWPKAGMLLRVPQVVYLSVQLAYLNAQRFNELPPLKDEADRIWTVYQGVKEQIEALRPGATFVSLVDWTDPSSSNKFNISCQGWEWEEITHSNWHKTMTYLPGGDRPVAFRYSDANSFPFIPMPRPWMGGPDFFATNFLHVFTGFPSFWNIDGSMWTDFTQYSDMDIHMDTEPGSMPYGGSATQKYQYDDLVDRLESCSPGLIDSVKGRLETFYGKFPGYALRVFTTNVGMEPEPIVINSENDISPDGGLHYLSSLTGWAFDVKFRERWAKEGFDRLFQEFADYDFRRAGLSGDIDADSLVSMIADHFRFDPDTGEDLTS